MTVSTDHLDRRADSTTDRPDERLGLALVLALVALFVLFSFLLA